MKNKIIIIVTLISSICKAQVYVKPVTQASLNVISTGVGAGYTINNRLDVGALFQYGNNYKEYSLFVKYNITNNNAFNIGLSNKAGILNNAPIIFFPALESEWVFNRCRLELGLRPTQQGLLFIEPRFKINLFNKLF